MTSRRHGLAEKHIDSITVRVSDERNRLIDLNGLHMNLAFQIDFVPAAEHRKAPDLKRQESLRLNPMIDNLDGPTKFRTESVKLRSKVGKQGDKRRGGTDGTRSKGSGSKGHLRSGQGRSRVRTEKLLAGKGSSDTLRRGDKKG